MRVPRLSSARQDCRDVEATPAVAVVRDWFGGFRQDSRERFRLAERLQRGAGSGAIPAKGTHGASARVSGEVP